MRRIGSFHVGRVIGIIIGYKIIRREGVNEILNIACCFDNEWFTGRLHFFPANSRLYNAYTVDRDNGSDTHVRTDADETANTNIY
jgi:hypothetical protein